MCTPYTLNRATYLLIIESHEKGNHKLTKG